MIPMYGRNNFFQNSNNSSGHQSSSNQHGSSGSFQGSNNKLGSYRTQYRYDAPSRDLSNAIELWSKFPPASILTREEVLHLTSTELRIEDYYLIRTKKLKSMDEDRLKRAIRERSFNDDLLKNECYALHPYSNDRPLNLDAIRSMVKSSGSNSNFNGSGDAGMSGSRGGTSNNNIFTSSNNSSSNSNNNMFMRNNDNSRSGGNNFPISNNSSNNNILNSNNNNQGNNNSSLNIFNRSINTSNNGYNNNYNSNNLNNGSNNSGNNIFKSNHNNNNNGMTSGNNIFNSNNRGGSNIFSNNGGNSGGNNGGGGNNIFSDGNGNHGNNGGNIFSNGGGGNNFLNRTSNNNGGNIFNNGSNNGNNLFNNGNNGNHLFNNCSGGCSCGLFNNNNNNSNNLFNLNNNNNNYSNSLFNNNNNNSNNLFNLNNNNNNYNQINPIFSTLSTLNTFMHQGMKLLQQITQKQQHQDIHSIPHHNQKPNNAIFQEVSSPNFFQISSFVKKNREPQNQRLIVLSKSQKSQIIKEQEVDEEQNGQFYMGAPSRSKVMGNSRSNISNISKKSRLLKNNPDIKDQSSIAQSYIMNNQNQLDQFSRIKRSNFTKSQMMNNVDLKPTQAPRMSSNSNRINNFGYQSQVRSQNPLSNHQRKYFEFYNHSCVCNFEIDISWPNQKRIPPSHHSITLNLQSFNPMDKSWKTFTILQLKAKNPMIRSNAILQILDVNYDQSMQERRNFNLFCTIKQQVINLDLYQISYTLKDNKLYDLRIENKEHGYVEWKSPVNYELLEFREIDGVLFQIRQSSIQCHVPQLNKRCIVVFRGLPDKVKEVYANSNGDYNVAENYLSNRVIKKCPYFRLRDLQFKQGMQSWSINVDKFEDDYSS